MAAVLDYKKDLVRDVILFRLGHVLQHIELELLQDLLRVENQATCLNGLLVQQGM